MGRQQQYVLMGRYNRDMNQRLFAAASRLEESQLRSNMGAFFSRYWAPLTTFMWRM